MRKVAIMTINSINYGNRLQNYALQKTIQSLGYEVETVRRTKNLEVTAHTENRLRNRLKEIRGTKKGRFLGFDRKYISFSRFHASPNEVSNGLASAYDIFVAGSDQIWNPHYGHIVGDSDLLTFASGKKRIAYAASIGVDSIPTEEQERYKNAWLQFDALSVRERAGAKLIQDLTGREAEVTLDPTLLLDAEQWDALEKKPRQFPKKNYVLVYALGGRSDQMNRCLESYKRSSDLEIYDIFGKDRKGKVQANGPSEFLYLIHHADAVVTNSFHALVFSSVFHTPVKVFPRTGIDMSSRIVSFAETVDLESNFTEDGEFSIEHSADFQRVDERIKEGRERSIAFLKEALEIGS